MTLQEMLRAQSDHICSLQASVGVTPRGTRFLLRVPEALGLAGSILWAGSMDGPTQALPLGWRCVGGQCADTCPFCCGSHACLPM